MFGEYIFYTIQETLFYPCQELQYIEIGMEAFALLEHSDCASPDVQSLLVDRYYGL